MAKPEYSGAWRRVRLTILERDGHVCQIQGRKCKGLADQVDHIVPVSKGGSWLYPSNLRAACSKCNYARVDHSHREGRGKARTQITLVVGPPAAGKSTYVDVHRRPGDLVIDYDRMAQAAGSGVTHGHDDALHGDVMAARNAMLARLQRGESDARQAWIISANANAESVFPYHDRIVVDPGMDAVLAQSSDAMRPDVWRVLIHEWYSKRNLQPVAGTGTGTPSRDW